jgi:hypothetical protein
VQPGRAARAFTVEFADRAPVGVFLEIEARIEQRTAGRWTVAASASAEQRLIASARGDYS